MTAMEAMLEYGETCVTGSCGHTRPFDEVCVARDEFVCPVCGHWWRVIQSAPEVMPSGFIMPGERKVVEGLHAL